LILNRNEGGQDKVVSEVAVGQEDYLRYIFFEEATTEIASLTETLGRSVN